MKLGRRLHECVNVVKRQGNDDHVLNRGFDINVNIRDFRIQIVEDLFNEET